MHFPFDFCFCFDKNLVTPTFSVYIEESYRSRLCPKNNQSVLTSWTAVLRNESETNTHFVKMGLISA